MGNQSSTSPQQQSPQLQDIYRIRHPILSQSQIILSKNIMKIHLPSHQPSTLQSWSKSLKSLPQASHEYLLLPHSYQLRQQMLCGSALSMTAVYECCPYVLMDQLENRGKIGGSVEEDQLWYLLWGLIDGERALMEVGARIGDVRPHNVLFNEIGEIKVINGLSWPGELSNFGKTVYEQKRTYLAVEQLHYLNLGAEDDAAGQMSQAFSIGLTLLSAIYMQDLSYLYQPQPHSYQLNTPKLQELLQKLPTLTYTHSYYNKKFPYSYGLVRIVQRMCQVSVKNRLGVNQVWAWLKPHSKNIVGFRPFQLMRGMGEKLSPEKEARVESRGKSQDRSRSMSKGKSRIPFQHSPIDSLQRSLQNTYREGQAQTGNNSKIQSILQSPIRMPIHTPAQTPIHAPIQSQTLIQKQPHIKIQRIQHPNPQIQRFSLQIPNPQPNTQPQIQPPIQPQIQPPIQPQIQPPISQFSINNQHISQSITHNHNHNRQTNSHSQSKGYNQSNYRQYTTSLYVNGFRNKPVLPQIEVQISSRFQDKEPRHSPIVGILKRNQIKQNGTVSQKKIQSKVQLQGDDLIRQIDDQLNRSKRLFPLVNSS